MDLPNLFSSGSKVTTEHMVLFLILTDIHVKVMLLELSNEGVKILDESKTLSYEGLDKCVNQTDKVLQQLGPDSENVTETVFALNTSWVKKGEIIDEKKPVIKKITEELSLTPLGFIDTNESIAQQKILENALYSGTIVVLAEHEIKFTLIYQGKVRTTEVVGKSSDFVGDFQEGIARIHKIVQKHGNYVPQKLLLASFDLSQKDLKKQQQALYDIDWKAHSQFLQPPTVDLLSDTDFIMSLSREAGKSAALHKGLTQAAFAADVPQSVKKTLEVVPDTKVDKPVSTLDSKELGFSNPIKATEAKNETAVEAPTSFGIPIESKEINMKAIAEADNLKEADLDFTINKGDESQQVTSKGVKANKKKFDLSHKKHTKWFVILGILLGIFVLVGGIVLGAPLLTSTEVTVTLNKKPVSKDIELTLDTSIEETDAENLTIAADTVQKTKSSTSTMQTTGITIIGEKAKGRVAVYNKTDSVKKFSKGTELKVDDLIFVLDDDITVASASASQDGEDYGRLDTNVTAQQIGADSNIEEKTELLVASYDSSSYNAFVIDDDFLGGSSREVRVVSADDRIELLTDLRNELVEEINKEFAQESGQGTYILPSKAVVDETAVYDAEVESEAEDLTLELEVTVEAVTYSGGDLKPVAEEILSKEVPENYLLVDSDPQILSSPSETDLDKLESGAVVSIEANISSYALPQLSEDSIKDAIVGKSFTDAEQALTAKEEISKAEFLVSPSIFTSLVHKVADSISKITVIFKQ
jgi:hypothetical protein